MTTFAPDGSVVTPPQTNGQPVPEPAGAAPEPQPDPPTPVLDPQPVTIDPEPAVPADPEPEVIEKPSAEVATREAVGDIVVAETWKHDWLDFRGDHLGIRSPTQQALAALSLASSKYVPLNVQNDITGLFIANHLSPDGYGRVFYRLMDPDDGEYTVETIGQLMRAIVMTSVSTGDDENK